MSVTRSQNQRCIMYILIVIIIYIYLINRKIIYLINRYFVLQIIKFLFIGYIYHEQIKDDQCLLLGSLKPVRFQESKGIRNSILFLFSHYFLGAICPYLVTIIDLFNIQYIPPFLILIIYITKVT